MNIRSLRIALQSNMAGLGQNAPLKSLTDLPERDAEETSLKVFLQTIEECAATLKKRKSTDAQIEDFFRRRRITTQEDMLRYFQDDPEQVAAYFISGKEVILIDRVKVYDWLVSKGGKLNFDTTEMVNQSILNNNAIQRNFIVKVEGREFTLNRLKAAAKSLSFQGANGIVTFLGIRASLFAYVANWIEKEVIPDLTNFSMSDFHAFQDILQHLAIGDELGGAVISENIRRFELKFKEGSILLTPADEDKIAMLHPYFRNSVCYIAVLDGVGNLMPLLSSFPNLKLLTLKALSDFNSGCLKGISCKVAFAGESYPKGAAKATQNLINFTVQDTSDWSDLFSLEGWVYKLKLPHLERLVIKAPMDNTHLKSLKNLKAFTAESVQMGDKEVALLCKRNPELESVRLPSSVVGQEGFTALAGLKNLKELHIGFNEPIKVTFEIAESYNSRHSFKRYKSEVGFQKLENLTLYKGDLTPHDITQIGKLSCLKEWDISCCRVIDLGSVLSILKSANFVKARIPCPEEKLMDVGNHINKHISVEVELILLSSC